MANIENYNSNSLVSGTAGNDYILNGGSNSSLEGVTIDAGSGDDTICNDNSDYSKIYAGEGDDSIKNLAWNALHVTIYGGNGNDFIHNTIPQASINGGDGNDTIDNSDDCADNGNTTIDGGAGNDSIKNDSPDVTITGGIGNDTVSLYSGAANNLIQYSYGDGNDIINGFNETSTLQIGGGNGTYSSQVSGSDIIVTVVDGKITLVGATSLATVNVEGTKGNLSIPADALKYNGHSYYVFANVADTWESAQAYCESLGGHLAVINNADENSAVYSYAMQSGYSEIFFGLSDAQNEGTWTWVNGEPVTYTNWEKVIDIEPNGGTRENYGSFKSMYTNGEWNDAYFGNSAFICEWDAVSSDSKLITLTEGNDSITNTLEGVTINALGGNDSIFNDNGSQVTIEGGAGNDYIHSGGYFHNSWHEGGSNNSIDGGAGDDYIINDHNSSYVTVNGGAGNDSIHSGGTTSQATLLGGDGNDSISNDGTSNLINCGAGNDSIRNTGSHALIQYTAGDGNDLIEGFNETSTLQIGGGSGTYFTIKSGSDIIVTVGKGKITLAGAATLSTVNISGTDKSTNAWTLDGTTATYGTPSETLITVSGVKSLDGISLSGSTVTISKSSLNQGTVSINNGYTLALGNDVTRTSTTAAGWSLNGSTSTYKTAATSAGYSLANNQITYVGASGGDKVFTLTGVKNTTGVTVDTSKKTVTLTADNLNKADVTVDGGYSLALSGVSAPSQTKAAGFDGLTYKTATMSDGYTSSGSKVTHTAASGGEKIFTLTGVKNTTGIAVDTSKKTVTLATDNLNQKKVTVDGGYTLKLGSDVNSPSTTKSWSLNKTTATYKQTTSAGYTLTNNAITYSKSASQTLATVKGVKSASGLKISDKTITVSKAALSTSKVTISDGYTLALAKDVTKSTTKAAGWTKSGTTATYKAASTTAGYKLANNQISYVKVGGGATLATVKGVKNIDGLSVKNEVVTLKKSSLNSKVTLGGSYEFNLAAGDYKKTSITGSANADVITSNGKNLSINGGTGNDTIKISGAGTTVTGGAGKDVFIYSGGSGRITDFGATDTLRIGDGNGTYSSETSGKNLIVTVGDNEITLVGAANLSSPNIAGTKKIDNEGVIVDGKKVTLTEDYDKDSFALVNGYSSIQTVDASKVQLGISITGNVLKNRIIGGSEDDCINGGKGADTILGGDGNDTLIGGAGNDCLTGDKGSDIFIYNNGDGNDVITDYEEEDSIKISKGTVKRISPTGKDVVFTIGTGKITVKGGRNKVINYIDAKGIEHFYPVDFDAKGTAATLLAAYAKDNFNISDYDEYADTVVKIDASAVEQDVLITANKKNNNILGGKGNDTLTGGKGNDSLDGGEGSDIFVYNPGDGNDMILNYAEEDKIKITDGTVKTSTNGKNVILTVGSNKITIKGAADKIVTYIDKNGTEIGYSNTVAIKGKVATLSDKYSRNTFFAGDYSSTIRTIDASKVSKNLSLTGSAFNDSIKAGAGDDTILGGRGDDTLTGGNGNDIFVYKKGDGDDVITDYKPGDKISIASSSVSDAVNYKGKDVVFTVNNSGTITVKNSKGKKITLIDKNGNESGKIYSSNNLWFTADDTNFDDADNRLSAIVKGSATAYSLGGLETSANLVKENTLITYSDKK